jgi:RNA recognition motif-containing protein
MDIHIFNLSQNVNEWDLRKLFSTYGEVNSAVIPRNKINGRSIGSAFINMLNDDLARQAIFNLDQTMIDGKRIAVSEIKFSLGRYNN